jgi:drug/metabolite transporter (DMT)-like permease
MRIEDNTAFVPTAMDFVIAGAVLAVIAALIWKVSSILLRRGIRPRHITALDEKLSRLEENLRDKPGHDSRS